MHKVPSSIFIILLEILSSLLQFITWMNCKRSKRNW